MAKKIEFPADLYNFSEMKDYIGSKDFKKYGAFSENQIETLIQILDFLQFRLEEWHNSDDTEGSHTNMRSQLKKMDAHLRNHRHDYSKTFTGKAEY